MKDFSPWLFKPDIPRAENTEMTADMYEAVLSCVQDGISMLKPDFTIIYANRTMRIRYNSDMNITGRKCYEVYHNRSAPCLNCPTLRAMRTLKPQTDLIPSEGASDSWETLYSVPVLNSADECIMIIEYVRDISVQKRNENNMHELAEMYEGLEAQNDALAEILKQRDVYREDLEQTITENFEKFVRPALDYLKKNAKSRDVDILSGIIDEIIYPITKKRPSDMDKLTPRELQICAMIKEGNTSKEIADKLFLSKKTVDFHRGNIRNKLKLNGDNLRSYLERKF